MDMKQVIISLVMLLAIAPTNIDAARQARHRSHYSHKPTTTAVAKADSTKDNSSQQGVVAVSDTSDVDTSTVAKEPVYTATNDDDDFDFRDRFGRHPFDSPAGVFIVISVLLFVFGILLLPVIIVILLLRFLMKRHKDNVRLEEERIKSGYYNQQFASQPAAEQPCEQIDNAQEMRDGSQPVNGNMGMRGRLSYNDILWDKGIKNVGIGLGLAIMFLCFDAHELSGIGFMIACFGGGQMYMSYSARQREQNRR
jgi:hypothetical protein